jgi:hypothetical protein
MSGLVFISQHDPLGTRKPPPHCGKAFSRAARRILSVVLL